eukprot:488173-Heterocapsa_arctica.AAC.1
MTPLGRAARSGHILNVQLLLGHRADVNATRTDNGFAPLHSAVFNGHADVALVLIAARAEVDRKCLAGATPLHMATSDITLFGCQAGKVECAKMLVHARAQFGPSRRSPAPVQSFTLPATATYSEDLEKDDA